MKETAGFTGAGTMTGGKLKPAKLFFGKHRNGREQPGITVMTGASMNTNRTMKKKKRIIPEKSRITNRKINTKAATSKIVFHCSLAAGEEQGEVW